MAKTEVFDEMFATGKPPSEIVEEKGLKQVSDTGEIEKICKKIIEENPSVIADIKAGTNKAEGFLVGQVMKASKGKANPKIAAEIIKKLLQ